MADQKLTTEEILAQARKEGAFGSGGQSSAEPAPAAEQATPEEDTAETPEASPPEQAAPSPPSKPAVPAAKPTSTADILAAARAQGGAGEQAFTSEPAAAKTPSKPAAKPTSTVDILAAARAQGASGEQTPSKAAAPSKPAAKPSSTTDILAAARAQGGSGAKAPAKAAASATAPKATKTSPKAPPAAKPAGERPSVAEMVKAAREGRRAEPEEEEEAASPKLPSTPPVPKLTKKEQTTRRSFFAGAVQWVTEPFMTAWAAMIALGGLWALLTARFMMPNMIVEPPTKFKIGPPSDYPEGTVSTKWKAARGIWVVHTTQYDGRSLVYALRSVCTHLGCTPNWLEGEQKFKCPCHGSGFYINGINFEGPAPRPLERVGLRLAEDGSLEVDKSVKFQEELGQWQDPSSYVELS